MMSSSVIAKIKTYRKPCCIIHSLKFKTCKQVSDECTVAVLNFTQRKCVIVDTHKHSENGTLIGIPSDVPSLLEWYQKTVQKHFNTFISDSM